MERSKSMKFGIIFTVVALCCLGAGIKAVALAQDSSANETALLLSDKDPLSGKPKVIKEWEIACNDLVKKSEQLEKQGLSKNEVIAEFNAIAAAQVAKKLGIKKASYIQEAVDRYYDALGRKDKIL